jgi:hypothetical protein
MMKNPKLIYFTLFIILLNASTSYAAKILIFKESFEPTNWFQWTSVQGGTEGASCGYYAYQDALYFDGAASRYAETMDLNLSFVNKISFQLFISYYTAPGCDAADSGSDVYLEYSTDGGANWVNIKTYKANTYTYAYFYTVVATIPTAAKTANTRLRWSQSTFGGASYDVWGLDEIEIYQLCNPVVSPVITNSGSTQLCDADTITLSATSQSNYFLWSNGDTTSSIKVTSTGNYYVLSADSLGCLGYSDTVEITSAKPSVTAIADDPSVCIGGTTQLRVAQGGNYSETFESVNDFWSSISLGSIETNCGGSTNALYFYDAKKYSDDRYAITNDLDLSAGGDVQFDLYIAYFYNCEAADYGEDVYFDYSTDGGLNWNNLGVYYASSNLYDPFAAITESLPIAAQTTHTRLRWYQLYYSCSYCDYWGLDNIVISTLDTNMSSRPYTYSWYPSTALSDSTIYNPVVSSVDSDLVYIVSITDTLTGCTNTDTVSLSVFTMPSTIITNANATICQGDTIKVSSAEAKYYQWSTGDSTQIINAWQQGDYWVHAIFPGGCTADDTVSLSIVVPVISSINANGPTSFCNGGTVKLTASSGTAYQWSNGYTTQSINVSNSGNYYVIVTDANGCYYKTPETNVINADPNVSIIEDSTTVCQGTVLNFETQTPLDFNEDFESINSSLWYDYTGYVGSYCFSNDAIYFYSSGQRYIETNDMNLSMGGTLEFDLYIDYYYYCDPAETGDDVYLEYSTDGGNSWNILNTYYAGTSAYAYFTKVTEAIPSAAQTYATRFRWAQYSFDGYWYDAWGIDEVNITNNYKNNYLYSWTPVSGLSNSNTGNVFATIDSTITYTLTVTDTSFACSSTNSLTIKGEEPPKAEFTYTIDSLTVSFTNASSYSDTYYWIFGDGAVSFNEDVSHTFPASGTYEVILKSKGNCGYDYDTVMIVLGSSAIHDTYNSYLINIYPNPSSGIFTIETPINSNILIYDLPGNKVLEAISKNGKVHLDLSSYAKGLYLLKVQIGNNDQQFQKLILK